MWFMVLSTKGPEKPENFTEAARGFAGFGFEDLCVADEADGGGEFGVFEGGVLGACVVRGFGAVDVAAEDVEGEF